MPIMHAVTMDNCGMGGGCNLSTDRSGEVWSTDLPVHIYDH